MSPILPRAAIFTSIIVIVIVIVLFVVCFLAHLAISLVESKDIYFILILVRMRTSALFYKPT